MDNTFFFSGGGKRIELRVDWAAMRRSAAAGVDLSLIEEHLGDFYRGSPKLMDALWAVVQGSNSDVSLTQLERAVGPGNMQEATDTLCKAVAAFYPEQRAAGILAASNLVKQQLDEALQAAEEQAKALASKSTQ